DPGAFLRYSEDWYDGSIRGMDDEIRRLVERLEEKGLAERTVIAFFADHGEEFHDHGRMFHGQSVYGEIVDVPLIFLGPGHVPAGRSVEEPVELIDVMPTVLEMSGLRVPAEAQGLSLRPLLAPGQPGVARAGWGGRPAIAEKHPTGAGHPEADESYAIVDK